MNIPVVNYIDNIYTKLRISKLSQHPSQLLSDLDDFLIPFPDAKETAIVYEGSRTKSYQYMLYDHSKRPATSNMPQLCEISNLLR